MLNKPTAAHPNFFQSIRYADFSSSFSDPGLGKSFEDLYRCFNEVIETFKKYRAEKEEHFNYLQTRHPTCYIGYYCV